MTIDPFITAFNKVADAQGFPFKPSPFGPADTMKNPYHPSTLGIVGAVLPSLYGGARRVLDPHEEDDWEGRGPVNRFLRGAGAALPYAIPGALVGAGVGAGGAGLRAAKFNPGEGNILSQAGNVVRQAGGAVQQGIKNYVGHMEDNPEASAQFSQMMRQAYPDKHERLKEMIRNEINPKTASFAEMVMNGAMLGTAVGGLGSLALGVGGAGVKLRDMFNRWRDRRALKGRPGAWTPVADPWAAPHAQAFPTAHDPNLMPTHRLLPVGTPPGAGV